MFTLEYKEYYIHGYCDNSECRVQTPEFDTLGVYASVQQAKRAISKNINRRLYK